MTGGYFGKIVWVNLTSRTIEQQEYPEDIFRKYMGGVGISAKILWEETAAETNPLSPQNPLIFMTGPCTATIVPSSGRFSVTFLSPLTNIWGESHAGGSWGYALKKSGVDGLVITGKSQSPVYLWINDRHASLVDAKHLWGKDTYETTERVQQETGKLVSVLAIGPAGENLVKIACLIVDGRIGRAAARGGPGAVMGSKNLKAIAVRGQNEVPIYDADGLKESVARRFPSELLSEDKIYKKFVKVFGRLWDEGRAPIQNFRSGDFPGFREKYLKLMTKSVNHPLYCRGCRTSCVESTMTETGRHPVAMVVLPVSAQCLIDDMEAVEKAYELCTRYGLDGTSTGGVISFAMELFEKGILTSVDTRGLPLKWGNHDAMLDMIRQIAYQEGLGVLLGGGVRNAADRIGGLAPEYALHVKGMEIPADDPRSFNTGAVEYATSNRGACHLSGFTVSLRRHWNKEFGTIVGKTAKSIKNPFNVKGCGQFTAMAQDYMCVLDSLASCKLLLGASRAAQGVQPSSFMEWFNLVTGFGFDQKQFMKTGERIFNLERMLNVRRGISRKDDSLPPRILTSKRGSGKAADNLPNLGAMLNEYYHFRDWDAEGIPLKGKLTELGLEYTVDSTF